MSCQEHCFLRFHQIHESNSNNSTEKNEISTLSHSTSNIKRLNDENKLKLVILEIKEILKEKPRGLSQLREMCLGVRKIVLSVSDLTSGKAR